MARGTSFVAHVVFDRTRIINEQLDAESDRVVRIALQGMRADTVTSMEGSGGGRFYGTHRASAPGRPPAVDLGFLRASIATKFGLRAYMMSGMSKSGILQSSSRYAPHLEYGTVRMRPRPFFRPIARKWRPIFEVMMAAAVKRATK